MEVYKINVKKRLVQIIILNGVILLSIFISGILNYGEELGSTENFIQGFQVGIFLTVEIFMLMNIIKYRKALNDEELLKNLYIEENDERTKFIHDKIGKSGFFFSVVIIAVGTVVAGFINITVFFTLLSVTVFMVTVLAFLKIYYRTKY